MRGAQYTESHRHSWWPPRPPWITLMILVSISIHLGRGSITCAPGIKSAGGKNVFNDFRPYRRVYTTTLLKSFHKSFFIICPPLPIYQKPHRVRRTRIVT